MDIELSRSPDFPSLKTLKLLAAHSVLSLCSVCQMGKVSIPFQETHKSWPLHLGLWFQLALMTDVKSVFLEKN